MKAKILFSMFLGLSLSSCIIGGHDDVLEEQTKSKGLFLQDMNPEVVEGEKGMRVYFDLQTKDEVTESTIPVTIKLLDRHKKPTETQVSAELNKEGIAIYKGETFTAFVFVPLPDSIITKGGTVYIDAILNDIPLERMQYTYMVFTDVEIPDFEEGGDIEFTPWDPTDPNDPNNPANK